MCFIVFMLTKLNLETGTSAMPVLRRRRYVALATIYVGFLKCSETLRPTMVDLVDGYEIGVIIPIRNWLRNGILKSH